jgi:hypothetical protein
MANNPDNVKGKPSYHEIPAYKYIFLFETAIHKRFFLAWTLFMFIAMQVLFAVVLGIEVIANFYNALLLLFVAFELSHWAIIPVEAAGFTVIALILIFNRRKRKQKERDQARLLQLRRQAYGEEVTY